MPLPRACRANVRASRLVQVRRGETPTSRQAMHTLRKSDLWGTVVPWTDKADQVRPLCTCHLIDGVADLGSARRPASLLALRSYVLDIRPLPCTAAVRAVRAYRVRGKQSSRPLQCFAGVKPGSSRGSRQEPEGFQYWARYHGMLL